MGKCNPRSPNGKALQPSGLQKENAPPSFNATEDEPGSLQFAELNKDLAE